MSKPSAITSVARQEGGAVAVNSFNSPELYSNEIVVSWASASMSRAHQVTEQRPLRQVVNESLRLDWLEPRRTPQGRVESHVGSRVRDGTFAVWFSDPYRALHGHESAQLNVRTLDGFASQAAKRPATPTTTCYFSIGCYTMTE